ncbi:variant-specific surface protein VSP4A1-like [Bolinopsis microptera]|uniref:variant-specific surface protein VSP4A1-like n=1 Tax=Bolinopsis microptera TaxID=2820187 RepID=UPI00307AE231
MQLWFASTKGASECVTCDGGTSTNQTGCLCEDGMTWKWDGPSDGSCKPCLANTYKAGDMISCQDCPSSSTSTPGSESCTCTAGSFWNEQDCEECSSGSASAKGASRCMTCDRGTLTNQSSCVCEDGMTWEWDSPITGSCKPCPHNSYKVGNMSFCADCPSSSTSPPGSSHCSCGTETFWSNNKCILCTGNDFFQKSIGKCTQCPNGTTSILSDTACSCLAGNYWHSQTMKCIPCPENYYSGDFAVECTKCPLYTISKKGSPQCQTCEIGQYWKQYTCDVCNELDKIGNGVFCMTNSLGKEGSSEKIVHGGRGMTAIIAGIAVVLGLVCIVLAVLMMKKKKEKVTTPEQGVAVRYSSILTPNVEYSDWPEGAGPSAVRLQEEPMEEERSWCAEWNNFTPGSEHDENIYSYLDDRVDQLREQGGVI